MSEEAAPWYAEGLKFRCSSCGNCCKGPEPGWVVMDQDDIDRLCAHLELTPEAFGSKYLRRTVFKGRQVVSLTEQRDNRDCVFWRDEVGCEVYTARPLQCRQWPFWPEILATPESWEAETEGCPGMNTGRRYSQAEIERISGGKRGTRRGRRPQRLPSV